MGEKGDGTAKHTGGIHLQADDLNVAGGQCEDWLPVLAAR